MLLLNIVLALVMTSVIVTLAILAFAPFFINYDEVPGVDVHGQGR